MCAEVHRGFAPLLRHPATGSHVLRCGQSCKLAEALSSNPDVPDPPTRRIDWYEVVELRISRNFRSFHVQAPIAAQFIIRGNRADGNGSNLSPYRAAAPCGLLNTAIDCRDLVGLPAGPFDMLSIYTGQSEGLLFQILELSQCCFPLPHVLARILVGIIPMHCSGTEHLQGQRACVTANFQPPRWLDRLPSSVGSFTAEVALCKYPIGRLCWSIFYRIPISQHTKDIKQEPTAH